MEKKLQNYEAILKELKIVKFDVRMKVNVLKSLKRIIDNDMPILLRERLQKNQNIRVKNLRNDEEYKVPMYMSDIGKKSFLYNGIKEFNKFQKYCKKHNLKKNIVENFITYYMN